MIADVLIVCNRIVGSECFFVGSSTTKQNYENVQFHEMCNVSCGEKSILVGSFLRDNLLVQITLITLSQQNSYKCNNNE